MATTRRTYLFPCTGYVASVPKALCPPGALTEDSREWMLSPIQGQIVRRGGTQMIGDTSHTRVGIFESFGFPTTSPTAWKALSLSSPSMTDGYPVLASIWGTDATERRGRLHVRSSNSGTDWAKNHTLGEDFSCSTTAGTYQLVSAEPKFHVTSFAYRTTFNAAGTTTSIGRTRLAFEAPRHYTAAGSRSASQVGDFLYLPNLHGQPLAWDKSLNETGAGTNRWYLRQWGHTPALYPPTKGATTAATGSDVNWEDGDTFYVSVIFKRADGSYSAPFIPRPVSATVTAAKGGLWTIGTPTATPTGGYRSVQWDNIPLGPQGTIARILCRSKKIRLTSTTAPLDQISPGKLFVTAILNNNEQTSYIDPNGSDGDLVADDRVIRFDHILPPCGRYSFEFDGRVAIGYTAPNPAAIILAPTGNGAVRDLNIGNQSSTLYGTIGYLFNLNVAVSGSTPTRTYTFRLRRCNGHTATTGAGTISDTTITCSSSTSLQTIIDSINATAANNEWAAQLAPGADINATGADLAPTSITVAACTLSAGQDVTTTTASGFADVAVGMRVSGTGIAVGAYVYSVTSTTAITIASPVASTNGSALSLTFFADTGDNNLAIIASCTTTSGQLSVTCSQVRHLHVGMGVSGTGIQAGSTVASITSSSTFTLSLTASGAGTNNLTFTRTGFVSSAETNHPFGNVRAFGPAWPETISFRGAYLDQYPIQKRDIYFTIGAPGSASMAAESFVLPNRRQVPASAGQFMGGAPLASGAVLCFANAIYTLENRRGGSTGEDFDYRTYELNVSRGCISPRSIVAFNGVVGYMTRDGYIVTDGKHERLISQDIYDPGTRRGSWSLVIPQAQRYAATDSTEDAFSASVTGTLLHITYNDGVYPIGPYRNSSRLVYDFSQGAEASGLNAVLRNVGSSETSATAYGWSCPLSHPCGPIAEVVESGGTKYYTLVGNEGGVVSVGGSIYQIDCPIATTYYDKAAPVSISFIITNGSPNVTALGGSSFSSIAVGATFLSTSSLNFGVNVVVTVLNKSADGTTASMNVNATGGPFSMSANFYGREIEPVGYMAMDMVESLREKKILHRLSVLHKSPAGGGRILASRDRLRLSQQSYTLTGSGTAEQVREVVEMNAETRTLGDVIEIAVTDNGLASTAQPEFWGVEAEVEVIDSEV